MNINTEETNLKSVIEEVDRYSRALQKKADLEN
jgi:hypothetical protein